MALVFVARLQPAWGKQSASRSHRLSSLHRPDHQAKRLRLPARLRLARQKISCSRAGNALKKAGAQARAYCQQLLDTRAGRALKRAGEKAVYATHWAQGQMTCAADQLEHRLPPRLAKAFHHARTCNPLAFSGFAARKFKQDPAFLTGYGVFSWGFSNLQTPLLIAMGMNAGLAVALRFATGVPMDIGVILWREHSRRDDRSRSFWGTVKQLGQEYRAYSSGRREANRRFIEQHRAAQNSSARQGSARPSLYLRQLGHSL
jgi:hypothetical protein